MANMKSGWLSLVNTLQTIYKYWRFAVFASCLALIQMSGFARAQQADPNTEQRGSDSKAATLGSIHVAVAANFAKPLAELIAHFRAIPGYEHVDITTTVASSGTLYSQIKHGAPYTLFFSADAKRPQALVDDGLVSANNLHAYALGKLVFVSKALTDTSQSTVQQMLKILQASVASSERIGVANPVTAPYGEAGMALLSALQLKESLNRQLVFGNNILHTYQFYTTGNVQHALVAQSLAQYDQLPYILVPQHYYQPIEQKMALINNADNAATGQTFIDFVLSAQGQTIIAKMGYGRVLSDE